MAHDASGRRPGSSGSPTPSPSPTEPEASEWQASEPEASPRIVLAYDLSADADRAAALVAAAEWPAGTVVRIVSSPARLGPGLSSFAGIRATRDYARQVRQSILAAQERVAGDLSRRGGISVRTAVSGGEPGRAIIRAARSFDADLIVTGARDQGPLAATFLGSVSAEIVEGAPCSVLVGRRTSVARVLFATDGSGPALEATSMLAGWPMFARSRIRVLGVGASPTEDGTGPATAADRNVDQAVDRLVAAHRIVDAEIRSGDIGTQILAAARDWGADLVVLGANGEPLLRRLLLGSVARQVLHGARSSALVVRVPQAGRGPR